MEKVPVSVYRSKLMTFIIILYFSLHFVTAQEDGDSSFKLLDIEEFIIQMNVSEDYLLLDVRSWMEYKKGRIPHAILAENNNVMSSLTDTLDRDIPLFLYCATNVRGKAAGRNLADKGFRNIYVLKVGYLGWKNAGKEVDHKRPHRTKEKGKKSDE